MVFKHSEEIREKITEYCKSNLLATINTTAKRVGCNRITAKKHLHNMASLGLIEERREGRFIYYLFNKQEGGTHA